MGERSVIEWTDSTWNPWRGCDKVSEGCDECYMFRDQERYGRDPSVVTRCAVGTFLAPVKSKKWAVERDRCLAEKGRHLVFTCSWSDWFHPKADAWRDEAWRIIRETPESTYQILTKRPRLIPTRLPTDWGDGYPNVWLGVSIETRKWVYRADLLRAVPAAVRFISAEPLLGPLVNVAKATTVCECGQGDPPEHEICTACGDDVPGCSCDLDLTDIGWIITGGESGSKHRRFDPRWAIDLRDACFAENLRRDPNGLDNAGPAFFHKQNGGPRPDSNGRLLEGRTYSEFPEIASVAPPNWDEKAGEVRPLGRTA
jgi:protein gp37